MNLKHFSKRYDIAVQGNFTASRKKAMFASLMSEMESAFDIPMQRNPEWELQNEEIFALYRKISVSRTL